MQNWENKSYAQDTVIKILQRLMTALLLVIMVQYNRYNCYEL